MDQKPIARDTETASNDRDMLGRSDGAW